eukprot:11569329-Heterocapsa_arctica.AAC.1
MGLVGVPPDTLGPFFEATFNDALEVSVRVLVVPHSGKSQCRARAVGSQSQRGLDELFRSHVLFAESLQGRGNGVTDFLSFRQKSSSQASAMKAKGYW